MHDFNPGIAANGLFWTIAIPPDAVGLDLGAGTAVYQRGEQALRDFHNIPNSLAQGPSDPATASWHMNWFNPKSRYMVNDSTSTFAGDFIETDASIEWSARIPSRAFTFTSAPASASTAVYAQIGRERNGAFRL